MDARSRNSRKRKKTGTVVESLEKRILYSGDVAGVAADAALAVLDDGEAVHQQMMDAEAPSSEEAASNMKPGIRVVVVDATLGDAETIADAAAEEGALVLRFDPESQSSADVLARVGSLADEHGGQIDSLSIVSHGSDGRFQLGNDWVDSDQVASDAAAWHDLGPRLADGANLYLYGCNVAEAGGEGQLLLDTLANATGADVFASNDLTGAGGDWDLEVASSGDEAERLAGLDGALDGEALAGVGDTLVDYDESGWSGSQTFTDGAISFTLSVTGGGDIDWEYDGATDIFSISAVNGTSSSTTISITDNNGGLNVGVLEINNDVGTITSDVDIAELRPGEDETIDSVVIAGGSGTLGHLEIPEHSDAEIHIQGNVTTIHNTELFETKVYVDGDVGTVTLDATSHPSGLLDVTGSLGTLHAEGGFQLDVTVGGDVTLIDINDDVGSTASFTVGGDVASIDLESDLDADLDVTGSVGQIHVEDDINGEITIGGDLDVLTVNGNVNDDITVQNVNGLITINTDSFSYQNEFVTDTQLVYDGALPAVTTSGPGLMDNLEGHWPMDEGSGQTVYDQSGNGNDATRGSSSGSDSNDPTWVWDSDIGQNVLDFDGNDYVDMGATFPSFSQMTVSAWVKLDSYGAEQTIISAGYDGSESQWTMKVSDAAGHVSFHRYDSGFYGAETTSTLTTGEWTHIAGTYDGSNWQIYVNGHLEATFADSGGITGTSQHVYIGAIASPLGDIQNFDGRIRDVRVFERTLDEDEITVVSGGTLNDPPTADDLALNVDEDDSVAINLTGSDPDSGDSVEKFRIDSLPSGAAGTLTLGGSAVNIGDEVTVAEIAAGDLVFTPVGDYNGPASFTFSAHDGDEWSASTATVSITVDPVNDAPTADALAANVDEDDSVALSLSGADIDSGDSVEKFRIDSLPSGAAGTLTLGGSTVNIGDEVTVAQIAAGDLVFTPVGDYNGPASFTFSAHDGDEWSASTATVSITVDPVNDAPTADAVVVNVDEDDSVAITLTGSDIDLGDSVERFRIESLPGGATGTLTLGGSTVNIGDEVTVAEIAAGDLVFTPTGDYNGPASFTYRSHDGDDWSASAATVSITVDPVNDAPTADVLAVNVDEDDSVAINLSGSDIDLGDSVERFRIDSLPSGAAGSLTLGGSTVNIGDEVTVAEIAAGDLVFTPTSDYNGPASFTFSAHDGDDWSTSTATVSITVDPVNDAPTADALAVNVDEDDSVAINLSGSDIDLGDSVERFRIDSLPSGVAGTLTLGGSTVNIGDEVTVAEIAAGDLVFSPVGDYNGPASFTFSAHDGDEWSASTATVSITVDPVNDAPTADALVVNVDEDDSVAINLSGTDIDLGDSVERFRIDSLPSGAAGTLTLGGSTVNIGDEVTVAEIAAGDLVFTSTGDYHGPASFTFSAHDGDDWSATPAMVSITVDPVNDAPTADALAVNVDEDDFVAIHLSGSDIDLGDAVERFRIDSLPSGAAGTLTLGGSTVNIGDEVTVAEIAAGDLVFTPAGDYHGPASFSFSAHDGDEWSSGAATVSITVDPVNDAPTADALVVNVEEDDSVAINLSGSDIDLGDSVERFRIDSLPSGAAGTLTLGGSTVNVGDEVTVAEIAVGDLVFTPAADYHGPASFSFSAHDGDEWSASTATVSITVDPVNDAPTADSLVVNVDEDDAVAINLSGTDIDLGDAVERFRIDSLPSGAAGTLTLGGSTVNIGDEVTVAEIAAGDLVFTPAADYHGPASFSFSAHDGDEWSATAATVSITVDPVNDAPIADAVMVHVDEDDSVAINLSGSDIDLGDSVERFRVDSLPSGAAGTLTLGGSTVNIGDEVTVAEIAAGDLVFTPVADYNGPAGFTFSAHDGDDWSATPATVSITVDPVNDAPTADATHSSAEFGAPIVVELSGSDIDAGDDIERYRVESLPPGGVLLLNGSEVDVGDEVTQAQIDAGELVFQADISFSGLESFAFSVFDGEDWSAAPAMAALEITGGGEIIEMPDPGPEPEPEEEPGDETGDEEDTSDEDAADESEETTESPAAALAFDPTGLEEADESSRSLVHEGGRASDFEGDVLDAASVPDEVSETRTRDDVAVREELATRRGPGLAVRLLDLDVPEMSEIGNQLSRRVAEEIMNERSEVESVQVAAVAASTGLLAILSRSSSLIAMAVATLPAWRYFDPLAIVSVPHATKLARDAALLEAEAEDDESGGRLREVLDG